MTERGSGRRERVLRPKARLVLWVPSTALTFKLYYSQNHSSIDNHERILQHSIMLATRPVARVDAKRRAQVDSRKRQFAKAQWAEEDYPYRMNFYNKPPTGDVSLEQFEEWGIARLKGASPVQTLPLFQQHANTKCSPRRTRSLSIPQSIA